MRRKPYSNLACFNQPKVERLIACVEKQKGSARSATSILTFFFDNYTVKENSSFSPLKVERPFEVEN